MLLKWYFVHFMIVLCVLWLYSCFIKVTEAERPEDRKRGGFLTPRDHHFRLLMTMQRLILSNPTFSVTSMLDGGSKVMSGCQRLMAVLRLLLPDPMYCMSLI
ncbi:hypothetical protein HanXRQr2_Chr13g0572271 [Helianthus annuus]|uniref:Uncharacterized protein n=1 Tax=Helianthus annuus TaxID=4232 RepID=A0A251SQI6_HELAN|nr:hypothetical protein HanXRQr2_Chr13g0572271 [Helianthus annuus]KAJ0496523.1 hypothetical protein HanHA89_Chr13g0500771 [Helianthus annuus]